MSVIKYMNRSGSFDWTGLEVFFSFFGVKNGNGFKSAFGPKDHSFFLFLSFSQQEKL